MALFNINRSLQRVSTLRYRLHQSLHSLWPDLTTIHKHHYITIAAVLAFAAWGGASGLHLRYGVIVDSLAGMLLGAVLLLVMQCVVWLLRTLLSALHRYWAPHGLAAGLTLALLMMLAGLHPLLALPLGLGLVFLLFMLVAAGLLLPSRPLPAIIIGLPPLALLLSGSLWLLTTNNTSQDPVQPLIQQRSAAATDYAALLQAGPYTVGQLSYGSGDDRWRKAFAEDAAWQSPRVDGRRMLAQPTGFGLQLRQWWWGFTIDQLPLNGRVWFPQQAEGSLPLILIVHGNHDMMHWSDTGYAWLAEHLASRGNIVVAVDENFLNSGLLGGLARENAARGWLVLEHLRAWRDWQAKPSHPLHTQADLNRVLLIGHSRGGEAVALAAAFNPLHQFPEDGQQGFDYGFGIRGVAAIAPMDGFFQPSDKYTDIKGPAYFVMQGGYDADIFAFHGDRQYARTQPDKHHGFRASLYLHHANHGQFNSQWQQDIRGPMQYLLNRQRLLAGDDQRRAALLYLTAFAESSLAGKPMPALFCDARLAGQLLPATLYVNRCDDGQRIALTDFERDIALDTGAMDGIQLQGQNLALWQEKDIGLRGQHQRLRTGAWLGWYQDSEQPSYQLHLEPALQLPFSARAVLWLDMAQADRRPPAQPGEKPLAFHTDALRQPLNIRIELVDHNKHHVQRPLNDFMPLLPPLPVQRTRLPLLDKLYYRNASEPLLQSFAVPLTAFDDGVLDLANIRQLSLNFDSRTEGVLIIDSIALEPALSDE